MLNSELSKALLTIEQARERFENGEAILMSGIYHNNRVSDVLKKKDHEPSFDYQVQVLKNQIVADFQFYALKLDQNGAYQYSGKTYYSEQPVDPTTGENMVEITVKRREVWTQDVKVYLPVSCATIEKAIEMVENDEGDVQDDTLEYDTTCHSCFWTVQGPTPELTRSFPIECLDVD